VGAVGNGDLRVALAALSLFRTIGLLMTALGAALGPAGHRTLARVLRLALRRPGAEASEDEIRQVDELLSGSIEMSDGDLEPDSSGRKTPIRDVLRLPFLMAYLAIWMARVAFMSFVVAPLLALVWWSRRYLADATAASSPETRTGWHARSLRCRRRVGSYPVASGPRRSSSWGRSPPGVVCLPRPDRLPEDWAATSSAYWRSTRRWLAGSSDCAARAPPSALPVPPPRLTPWRSAASRCWPWQGPSRSLGMKYWC